MVETKFFDWEEAKSIALKHIEWTNFPVNFRQMLEQIDWRFDYIFDVLEHEIRAGDIDMRPLNKFWQVPENVS